MLATGTACRPCMKHLDKKCGQIYRCSKTCQFVIPTFSLTHYKRCQLVLPTFVWTFYKIYQLVLPTIALTHITIII